MPNGDLKALTERHIDVFNRHDPVQLALDHTPDGVVASPMFGTVRGRAAIEETYRVFLTSFPDATITIETTVVDAPRIALFLTIKATHAGEFYGLSATHKHIQVPMARLVTFEGDLIAHERRIYDFTGLLVQVGVLRAKPVSR